MRATDDAGKVQTNASVSRTGVRFFGARAVWRRIGVLAFTAAAWFGCGSGGGPGAGSAPGGTDPTFSNVYVKVFLGGGCLQDPCHGSTASGDLLLRPRQVAYASLVGVVASGSCAASADGGSDAGASCGCFASGLERVKRGDPEHSLIVLKLSGSPPCGESMPKGAEPLAADAQSLLESWIRAGAPEN
ncbi:MAG TPA: hypothetical protein VF395_22035 [Polyangiaceae bacterium]